MRIAYGAGAVAVVSVIAVGLVQPDFTATADQPATNDANVADAANQANGRTDQSGNGANQPDVQVKHVVKYIHLKPGQSAPPGAKVITPGQPTPRVVVANNPAPNPKPTGASHNPNPGNNNPPPPPPPPQATPRPTPRPTVKTRQSGHP